MSMKLKGSGGINYSVDTIAELEALAGDEGEVVVVSDENRGGTFVYRSAESGTNNSGTIFNGWCRQYDGAVNVKWFGDSEDGLIKAISIFSEVSAVDSVITLSKRIDIIDSILVGGTFTFSSNSAKFVLTGKSTFKDAVVTVGTYSNSYLTPLGGIINIHLGNGVVIDNIEITDGSNSGQVGIFCSTIANNTTIKNCKIDYASWGILFNDQVAEARIVDGIDYTGQSIGSGLILANNSVGATDKLSTAYGDAIEINTPSERFKDIKCIGNVCKTTKTSNSANGLGFGFANVDNIVVSNNTVSGVDVAAGALHVENSTNVNISDNVVYDSTTGVSASANNGCIVSSNSLSVSQSAITSNSISSSRASNYTINSNVCTGTYEYGVLLYGHDATNISDNVFENYSINAISINSTEDFNAEYIGIYNNIFVNTSNVSILAISTSAGNTVKNLRSQGNTFNTISGKDSSYITLLSSYGVSNDYIKTASDASGFLANVASSPTGYIANSIGSFAIDTNNGVIYMNDGTAWVDYKATLSSSPLSFTSSEPVGSASTYTFNIDISGIIAYSEYVSIIIHNGDKNHTATQACILTNKNSITTGFGIEPIGSSVHIGSLISTMNISSTLDTITISGNKSASLTSISYELIFKDITSII